MRLLAATGAAIVLLAIAAGCGGGSADGDAAEQADAACAEANRRIAALGTPDDPRSVLEYLEATEAAVEQLRTEITALDESGAYRRYARALTSAADVLNEMSNAARSGNPDAVRELAKELERLHAGRLAAEAGLETCAAAPGVET